MAPLKFSKTAIDKLPFSSIGQVDYWDTETKGLGLRVGSRTKTFMLKVDVKVDDPTRPRGYKTVKKTLGRYGLELTYEQAKGMISGYIDANGNAVLGERLKMKLSKSRDTFPGDKGDNVTLKELLETYYRQTKRRDGKERKEKTAGQYTALVHRHYAGWMDLLLPEISAITPDAVLDKYRSNEHEFGAATARNSSSVLSAILNYGRATYPSALHNNPLAVLSNPHVCVRQGKRARHDCLVYDPEKKRNDFPVFLNGLQVCTDLVRDGFLFCLYTGMRRSEVEGLQWVNVDMDHKELLLEDTKNRQDLHIPLNSQAMAILQRRKDVALDDKMVFPAARAGGKNRTGHIQLNPTSLKRYSGLDLTVHGLRRTFITTGRKLKRFEDTDRLTNHIDNSMAGRHYDETGIEDLRDTAQMIGNEIERRLIDAKAKVLLLGKAQAMGE
jgi:integrase